MRWRFPGPEIGEEDGFEGTDLFGYARLGTTLANMIGRLEDDPVIVLDGDWGSGKTTFARQWAGLLRRRGNAVLYFDAFASDHQEDALLAFAEEVYCFAEKAGVAPAKLASFADKVAEVFKAASVAVLPPFVGKLTGVDATHVAEKVSEAVAQGPRLRAWISEAAARRQAVEAFRRELECIARATVKADRQHVETESSVSDSGRVGTKENGRFVIIVDELDRCKPAFALSVLERVKHVVGVPEVIFVLVANLNELGNSVRSAYGDVDADRYLEKFFDLVVRLPDARDAGRGFPKTDVYARYLQERLSSSMALSCLDRHRDALVVLAEKEQMSLRTMEHVVRNVAVLELAGYQGGVTTLSAPVLVSVIRVAYPEIFSGLKSGQPERLDEDDWGKVVELAKEIVFGANRDVALADDILDKSKLTPHQGLSLIARQLDSFEV